MSSIIIEQAYRNFALYTLDERAVLYIQDGLRASIRRALWVSRNQHKQKTIGLSGAMTTLHPHGDASKVVQNFTSMFKNNIPYFDGNDAGFGTLLNPSDYSAPRYTSVKKSTFAEDVILVDLDIVPMIKNYDETVDEPKFLLPLVPLHFINPILGMAIGYKCCTLPYKLNDIINSQICVLNQESQPDIVPYFKPLNQVGVFNKVTTGKNNSWSFSGTIDRISNTKWRVTSLPFGVDHGTFINHLQTLYVDGAIVDIDDSSSDQIDCIVTFPKTDDNKNVLHYDSQFVFKTLKLIRTHTECLYFINCELRNVKHFTVNETIETFTLHRLQFYKKRLELINSKLIEDLTFYKMWLKTIEIIDEKQPNLTKFSRSDFQQYLHDNGVTSHVDKITNLSLYKFNTDEITKLKKQIDTFEHSINSNNRTMKSDALLRRLYISELKEVQKKHA